MRHVFPMPWLLMLIATLAMSACTSAGLCTKGNAGCRPKNNGLCADGLVKMGDLCATPGSGGTGTTGGTGMTGGTGGAGGTGGSGGGPPDESCAADDLVGACTKFCDAFCNNQKTLCVASSCKAGECAEGGELFGFCMMQCDSAECAQQLCLNEFERTCEDFGYREDATAKDEPYKPGCYENDPTCVLHGEERCSDSCGTVLGEDVDPAGENDADNGVGGNLTKNGVCEDGGGTSSDLCPRGTDCSDCGLRECIAAAESCADHEDCCGYFDLGAFCVNVGGADAPDNRCLLSCTATETCPDTQTCVAVSNGRDRVCAPR